MRNRKLIVLIVSLAVLALTCMTVFQSQGQTGSTRKKEAATTVQEDVKAVRRGGLREAAKRKGHYVSAVRSSGWIKEDVDSLTKNSLAVIVGEPVASTSRLSSNDELITTQYQMKIREVLKGDLVEGRVVKVNVMGGRVTFEDGTSAEIKTLDMEPIERGKSYVLFLKEEKNDSGIFGLTSGGQGLFELSDSDSIIQPRGDRSDVVQKHKNQRKEDFLQEIKIAVSKYQKASRGT